MQRKSEQSSGTAFAEIAKGCIQNNAADALAHQNSISNQPHKRKLGEEIVFEKDALQARGKALEDEYFSRVDADILARMRDSLNREEAKKLLVGTLGFEDETLIKHLLDAGIDAGTVSALVLVPLIFVAWSDGEVSSVERQTIMSEALHRGFRSTEDAFHLIEHWLEQRPHRELWTMWCEYIEALRKSLPSELERVLSGSLFNRCEAVAQATTRPRGTPRISKPVSEMLDRIQAVLSKV